MAHPDLPLEQAYVDNAYACLDRMREALERSPSAGAGEVAQEALEAWASRRLVTFADAERGLCFGRMDVDGAAAPLYVGRRWVHDDDHDVLVVNWQAPAARPFYTATPVAPHGVTLRRRFRTRGREVLDISDEALDGSLAEGAAAVDDFLLEELERSRDAHMRDIVATIQADQYRLIARDPAPPLVIQGGPGTGKTAVGLHRASFLLYAHREELRRILVVGPNPTFMDYVSHVLPILGEESVDQRAVAELVDGIEVSRADRPEVERLKSDLRLAEVVRRAVELRLEPRAEAFEARLDGAYVRVREEEVEPLRRGGAGRARSWDSPRASGSAWSSFATCTASTRRSSAPGRSPPPTRSSARCARRGSRASSIASGRSSSRMSSSPSCSGTGRGSRRRPATCSTPASSACSPAERPAGRAPTCRSLTWPARCSCEPPRAYGHVIVDEAQDLTPMELAMVARRMRGAFTLLGDIAQGTGPVPYAAWDELTAHLPGDAAVEELEHAYRVPREIMDFALPLLPAIAPDVRPPRAYRTGAEPPRVVADDAPLARAFAEAARLAGDDALVAIIAPPSLRRGETAGSVFDDRRVPVLTPREAKGLEFDHVVVVEPALIVDEGGATGLRELYVALTRPTKSLLVTHARDLPPPLR